VFQNEKCHILIEHETQKLKELDEEHSQELKEWREKLRPRKKVTITPVNPSQEIISLSIEYLAHILFQRWRDL
jgi:hypothetical protein